MATTCCDLAEELLITWVGRGFVTDGLAELGGGGGGDGAGGGDDVGGGGEGRCGGGVEVEGERGWVGMT